MLFRIVLLSFTFIVGAMAITTPECQAQGPTVVKANTVGFCIATSDLIDDTSLCLEKEAACSIREGRKCCPEMNCQILTLPLVKQVWVMWVIIDQAIPIHLK